MAGVKNAKPILAAVTVLAVLALIVRQVTQAVWHTFASPAGLAHVDRSTPLIQNGLTLLDVESVSSDRPYMYTDKGPQEIGGPTRSTSDDTGFWIQLPEGHFLPADCSSDNSGGEPALSISTRTSTGRSFPLHWTVMDNQAKAGLVLAFIPAGYPDSVQWMDVTFSDRIGHVATWRIQNLPRMQHVLRPPLTAQTDFRQKDVRVTATVYRQAEPSSNGQQNVLSFDVKGDVSKPVYQWELGSLRANLEWEPPASIGFSGGTFGSERTPDGVKIETSPQSLYDSHTNTATTP